MAPAFLADSTVVARAPGLVPLRSGERLLVVSPEAGTSVLLEGPRLRLFQDLVRPMPAGELIRRHSEVPPGEVRDLLATLHSGGMLCVGGRPPEVRPRPLPAPPFASVVTLRLTAGCSPACRECAWTGETPLEAMPPERAREAVARALEDLPPGRVLLDLAGGEPLLARGAVEAVLGEARALRQGVQAVVRTGGLALDPEAAAFLQEQGAEVVLCLHEAPSGPPGPHQEAARKVLEGLPRVLETGLAVAPAGIVTRPEQAVQFYDLFMGMGYRTFRLEAAAPDAGRAFLDVVDRVAERWRRIPSPVRIHPLARMARQAMEGAGRPLCPHPECGSGAAYRIVDPSGSVGTADGTHGGGGDLPTEEAPRCARCALRGLCRGGCRHRREGLNPEPLCAWYREVYEGLLWRLHDHPDLCAALGL